MHFKKPCTHFYYPHSRSMEKVTPQVTKKEQIASLYKLGITGVNELSSLTQSSPSYVASVLRDNKLLGGYFDLYTSSERPMNVYSRFFAGRLGFKNVPTARSSLHYLDTLYHQFERIQDRAGQHHTLYMALTMRNRALWSNKPKEAEIFGKWLRQQLRPFKTKDQSLGATTDKQKTKS